MACFRAQTEAERQHLSAKSRLKGEPGRFVRAAGRSMCAPAETSSHRAKTDGARRCAQTTSAVRRRLNEKTDSGEKPSRTDRKSTRLNSSHQIISYAVFCLKKKKIHKLTI